MKNGDKIIKTLLFSGLKQYRIELAIKLINTMSQIKLPKFRSDDEEVDF
jgi:hypothetical protein